MRVLRLLRQIFWRQFWGTRGDKDDEYRSLVCSVPNPERDLLHQKW